MIFLELLIGFLKVGLFSFGGAYAAIPLIRDVVLEYGWMDEEALVNMIAISESSPGPIMVNLATYVGYEKGGIPGALLATFAVVLPAFLIILLIMVLLKKFLEKESVKAILRGLKPCIIGIILATGAFMIGKACVLPMFQEDRDFLPLVLAAALATVFFGSREFLKKKMSPIVLIVISAGLGILAYGV